MSIQRTLHRGMFLGLSIVLAVAGAVLFQGTRSILTREFDATLRAKVEALKADTEYDEDGKIALDVANNTLPEFQRHEFYELFLPDGQTVARSPSLGFDDLPVHEGDVVLPGGRRGRAVIAQFVPQPAEENTPVLANVPAVTLVVARDRITLDRTLSVFKLGLLLVGGVVLCVSTIVVLFAVRRGLAPLEALSLQVTMIDASSLQTRFATEKVPEELRPITRRLNDLFARLDEAFQRERRVSADIAHELRTPIAELRALAEVGVKWPEEASYRDALEIAQRMESLVTGLLALARHEAGQQPLTREPVAVRQLVDEVWQPLAARAKQLDVSIDVAGQWQTDPTLLRLILTNLLENAVEYSTGKIRLTGNDTRFEVVNSCNGLTPEDLPHLFERFWRKDAARSANGHTGLGLTLAQTAATALGMKLEADMPETGVLRVTLQ